MASHGAPPCGYMGVKEIKMFTTLSNPDMKPTFATFSLCLALLMASASCTDDVDESRPPLASVPIAFSTTPFTRAAVEGSFPDGSAFSVWGWYASTQGTKQVFDDVPVTNQSGSWSYPNIQYWVLGATYNFFAVYPSELTGVSCDAQGKMSIRGFDASATGEKAVDLMTASATGISHATAEEIEPVGLEFEHRLAKVNIVGESEGSHARITSISLSGIGTKGDYDSSNTPPWSTPTEGDTPISPAVPIDLPATPTDVFGDLLMIPQDAEDVRLAITYEVPGVEGSTQTVSATLPDIGGWEAGKSYRYSFVLTNDYIIFGVPQVDAWDEASGGIIIVD